MKLEDAYPSSYLAAVDFQMPRVLQIRGSRREPVGPERKEKSVLYFANVEKGLVLNKINWSRMADLFGSSDTDTWGGREIEIYFDPSVSFAGKTTGGLRVRAPRASATVNGATTEPGQATMTAEQMKEFAEFLKQKQHANPANMVTDAVDEDGIDQVTEIPPGMEHLARPNKPAA